MTPGRAVAYRRGGQTRTMRKNDEAILAAITDDVLADRGASIAKTVGSRRK